MEKKVTFCIKKCDKTLKEHKINEKYKRYIDKCTILLFLSAAVALTGCGNNSHADCFGAVENVEYNKAGIRDDEADLEDDMAAAQELEVLNNSEKSDIDNDTDLSTMEIYERFLNGELTVEQKKEQIYISDLFWDNDIEYCFGDVDSDGNEELHIRDNSVYYMIKAEDGTPRIIFKGWWNYEPIVMDELCGILYYSNRYGFERIEFMIIGADGSEKSREEFYWSDDNKNGNMDEEDFFRAHISSSEEIDMEQYVQYREEEIAKKTGNKLEWTGRRCKDFASWQEAYIDFLKKTYSTTYVSEYGGDKYSLIYVDNNDVPELYIDTGCMAGGEIIVSFYDGKVRAMNRDRSGIEYMEYGGLLYSSLGNAGFYPCNIYMLEKGEFSEIGTGWYTDHYDEFCYFWEDSRVTEAEFEAHINELIDTSKCIEPSVLYTKDEILGILAELVSVCCKIMGLN